MTNYNIADFNVSIDDVKLIERIIFRAIAMKGDLAATLEDLHATIDSRRVRPLSRDLASSIMDLCAAHNFCPLDLPALLAADDANFSHDVFGILRHVNRTSGELGGGFRPRYAIEMKGD